MDLFTLLLSFIIIVQICVRICRYYMNHESYKFTLLSLLTLALGAYCLWMDEIGFATFVIVVNMLFATKVDIKITDDKKKADKDDEQ